MTDTKEVVIVGSGGIARRHIENLGALFPKININCLPISTNSSITNFQGISKILGSIEEASSMNPDYAIVASPASSHLNYAAEFLKKDIPVLIEKPLTTSLAEMHLFDKVLLGKSHLIEVAYCLRFLPAFIKLQEIVSDRNLIGYIYSVIVEVGQFLPDWRPNIDYKLSVSANKSLGGGVLLELSHELDYLISLFGPFTSVYCDLSNTNALEINVEDRVDAILKNNDFVVNIHMDFLQRFPSRTCKIIGKKGSVVWNIIDNKILFEQSDGKVDIIYEDLKYDKNKMYLDMLSRFDRFSKQEVEPFIDIAQSSNVIKAIDAMRKSSDCSKLVKVSVAKKA